MNIMVTFKKIYKNSINFLVIFFRSTPRSNYFNCNLGNQSKKRNDPTCLIKC